MRSSDEVHEYLEERGIPHRIVQLSTSSRTAALAAAALGVGVAEVVKSLLFVSDDAGPVLVLVNGDVTVDAAALACETGVAEMRLARAREVRELTGYQPGAIPPCALATEVPVIADFGVFTQEVVYCGGGSTTSMLRIRSADLASVTAAEVLAVAARPGEGLEGMQDYTPAAQER